MKKFFLTALKLAVWAIGGWIILRYPYWRMTEDLGSVFALVALWMFMLIHIIRQGMPENRGKLGNLDSDIEFWNRLCREQRRQR